MSKYVLLMSIVLFLTFISVIAISINVEVTSNVLTAQVSQDVPGVTGLWNYAKTFLSLFFNIIAFRVPGLPFAFTLFIFWPLSAGVIFIIISIVRGTE